MKAELSGQRADAPERAKVAWRVNVVQQNWPDSHVVSLRSEIWEQYEASRTQYSNTADTW